MEVLVFVCVCYLLIGVLIFVVSVLDATSLCASQEVKRGAARTALLSPIWPMIGVIFFAKFIGRIVRTADLGNSPKRTIKK